LRDDRPLNERCIKALTETIPPAEKEIFTMITRKMIVHNEHGIHARVALKVVEKCQGSTSQITVCKGCEKADGCSLLALLMLGAEKGTEIEIIADGGEEQKSINDLAQIFSQGSGI
jgi:phosphocarrier protein HPr